MPEFTLVLRRWNHLDNPELGFMNGFGKSITRLETRTLDLLPDLHQGQTIFVGSDYSGQHDSARYQSLTFLFADLEQCAEWERLRRRVRKKFLPDGRRLSYKDLGDRLRQRALVPFLQAANSTPGLVVCVLVDKQVQSLFKQGGRLRAEDLDLSEYACWNSAVLEKLLRVVHLVSFFVAGLSRSGQDVLWITDEDAIVPNEQRHQDITRMFANVCSHYLQHNLRHAQIGTTEVDSGSRDIEDLVAIPDLVAGSLCRLLTEYQKMGQDITLGLVVPPPKQLPAKARVMVDWLADTAQSLKRQVYLITEEDEQGEPNLRLRYIQFPAVPRSVFQQAGWRLNM